MKFSSALLKTHDGPCLFAPERAWRPRKGRLRGRRRAEEGGDARGATMELQDVPFTEPTQKQQ